MEGQPAAVHSTVRPTAPVTGPMDLLLAARPTPLLRAVVARLTQLGQRVAATSPGRAQERLDATEPLVAVLDLEACARAELVRALHARGVPIVVLGSGPRLRTAMAAHSLGARQVIDASASVDALCVALGGLGAASPQGSPLAAPQAMTLGDLLASLEQELRASLSRFGRVPARGDLRFTVRDPELLATYVRRLRAALSRVAVDVVAAPCELTGELVSPRVDSGTVGAAPKPLGGARIVLIDPRVSRADAFAGAFRAAGADVFALSPEELLGELSRIAELDPTAILVEEELGGTVERLLAEIAGESRLRFAQLVAAPLGELWDPADRSLDRERLLDLVLPSHAAEREVADRLLSQPRHGVDLARLGPARLLYAVALAGVPVRLTHVEASCLIRVELAGDGILAGASARLPDRTRVEGPAALAVFLRRTKGTVDIERLMDPSLVSLLAPVATAIGRASGEVAPVLSGSFPPGPATRVSWSSMPAPLAGRITWTSIPAIAPEELSAYAIKDASELLDAVDDDDDDEHEAATIAFDPARLTGASLRLRPPPAIVPVEAAPEARIPRQAPGEVPAPAALEVAVEPVADKAAFDEPTRLLPALSSESPPPTGGPAAPAAAPRGDLEGDRLESSCGDAMPSSAVTWSAPAPIARGEAIADGLSPQFVAIAAVIAMVSALILLAMC